MLFNAVLVTTCDLCYFFKLKFHIKKKKKNKEINKKSLSMQKKIDAKDSPMRILFVDKI